MTLPGPGHMGGARHGSTPPAPGPLPHRAGDFSGSRLGGGPSVGCGAIILLILVIYAGLAVASQVNTPSFGSHRTADFAGDAGSRRVPQGATVNPLQCVHHPSGPGDQPVAARGARAGPAQPPRLPDVPDQSRREVRTKPLVRGTLAALKWRLMIYLLGPATVLSLLAIVEALPQILTPRHSRKRLNSGKFRTGVGSNPFDRRPNQPMGYAQTAPHSSFARSGPIKVSSITNRHAEHS